MAKYTGRRIVPKHAGEWNIRKEYEELQIVLDTESGNSYISNLPVPKGTALTDEKYWSLYSLYSEQIAEAEEHLTQTAGDIRTELSETECRINESLSSTESKVNTSLSETENRVTARVENAKSDLNAKVTAAEQQMNQSVQNIEQTSKNLNARMDQIAKGKTTNTEILDARVDAEGNSFDNLGAAIRSIYPKAKAGLDALEKAKLDANYDATGELTEGITVNTINGGIQNFEHVRTTAMIPVDSACQKIYYTGQVFNWIGIAGYDATGVFVASILDSRDTEQPREYKEKELELPEGVYQIRASSYYQDMKLEVRGNSAKLWNQIQQERQNQKKMAIEIEALRSADDSLAKETMTSLELPFLYDGVSNIWEGSNPVLQTYYVPLTVLRSAFVQEIQFTLRTIGATSLTAMIESDDGEVFRQTVELVKGDNKITLTLHRFMDEGAYKLRVRSTDKVLYYPVRPNSGNEIRNEFFSNEPSGNVQYDYKNRLIVFMGKILIGTGKVDETLSYSGMAADAAVVGQAFQDEREYTDTVASGKLDAVRSRNLLDPSKYRPGWFAYVHSSVINYHADNLRYGSTDYIPVSEKGLVTKGSGTNGVTSQVIFDKAKKVLRYVDANDQYTYQEGDAYVMFFYMASSGQGLCIVEGTEYVYEAYTDYKPLDELKQDVKSLRTEADNQKKQLTNLTTRLDQLVAVPEKKDLRLIPAAPVYTVCNNLSTARNYHVSVWVDHLIADTGWKDKAAGFGTEMEQSFDLYSPFTNTAVNGGEDVLEQTVEKSFVSDTYKTQKLTFKHRSTLASMGKTQFPKILVIGDSVTDGYLAGVGKTDADLPTHYWAWVRYLFELDRKDAKAAENEYRCLMLGMPGTVNGKHYGSSSSFKLDGKTIVNYAMQVIMKQKSAFTGKKILFLGDSITALNTSERGWVRYFNEIIQPEQFVNLSVSSARWCDYADTVYDGNPVFSGPDQNHNNVMGNQVEKLIRGKDKSSPHYKEVAAYADFDMILIACGTNDGVPSGNIEGSFTSENEMVAIEELDRKVFASAFRYSIEKLQQLYPAAKIYICTPIQGYITTRSYAQSKAKGDYLKLLAGRMSLEVIDTFNCGICDIYEKKNANGRYLIDGLHPNAAGAKKIGVFNANAVIASYR